jgi:hypothetical protein
LRHGVTGFRIQEGGRGIQAFWHGARLVLAWCWYGARHFLYVGILVLFKIANLDIAFLISLITDDEWFFARGKRIKYFFDVKSLKFEGEDFSLNTLRTIL